jgi:hypothetical protein
LLLSLVSSGDLSEEFGVLRLYLIEALRKNGDMLLQFGKILLRDNDLGSLLLLLTHDKLLRCLLRAHHERGLDIEGLALTWLLLRNRDLLIRRLLSWQHWLLLLLLHIWVWHLRCTSRSLGLHHATTCLIED